MTTALQIEPGRPLPWGAYHRHGGVNFSLFSRSATRVWLELYDRPEDGAPAMAIELDPDRHRTGDMWHVWLKGATYGQLYAFRVYGPYQPAEGHRFNHHRILIDPYATALLGTSRWDWQRAWPSTAIRPSGTSPSAPRRTRIGRPNVCSPTIVSSGAGIGR